MKFIFLLFILVLPSKANAQIDIDFALFGESAKSDSVEKSDEELAQDDSEGKIDLLVIEENKKLPQVSYAMADEFVAYLGAEYAPASYVEMDDFTNELKVIGLYEKNGTVLRYRFNRSLSDVFLVSDYLENDFSQNVLGKVRSLDDEPELVDVNKFSVKAISSRSYFTYINPKSKKLVLLTNIGPYLSLRVQADGPEYFALTKNFLDSLGSFEEQKSIVGDTGKVKLSTIKHSLRNDDKMKSLMNKIEKN